MEEEKEKISEKGMNLSEINEIYGKIAPPRVRFLNRFVGK